MFFFILLSHFPEVNNSWSFILSKVQRSLRTRAGPKARSSAQRNVKREPSDFQCHTLNHFETMGIKVAHKFLTCEIIYDVILDLKGHSMFLKLITSSPSLQWGMDPLKFGLIGEDENILFEFEMPP